MSTELSGSLPRTLVLSFRARPGARPLVGSRVSTTAQRVVAVAIVPMAAVTAILAVHSDHLQRPGAAARYIG